MGKKLLFFKIFNKIVRCNMFLIVNARRKYTFLELREIPWDDDFISKEVIKLSMILINWRFDYPNFLSG